MPANLQRFLGGFDSYDQLLRWSLEQPEEFWPAVWRFCGVKAARPWTRVWNPDTDEWFAGAELNFAATLLRPLDLEPAIEAGDRCWSHRDLYHEVARMVKALEAAGIRPGDCVAALLPASPEAVIALLAAAALGSIWTPAPEDPRALAAVHPKLLFATDLPSMEALRNYAAAVPSLRQVIVVARGERSPALAGLPRALRWQDSTAFYQGCHDVPLAAFAFAQPLLLLDGRPAVYSAGGVLVQLLKESILQHNVQPDTRIGLANAPGPVDLLRAAVALAAGAVLDFNAPYDWPAAALPASFTLPHSAAPALGVHAGNGAVRPPCPSLPVNWPV
ncbi:MAG: AMP-binding protein [Bryobacteraceae bacterium]|nr:AMP-binding protein [Bryobacteraceae bacterium]